MEQLYDLEWVEGGINRQETGLTAEEADSREEELVAQGCGDIRWSVR